MRKHTGNGSVKLLIVGIFISIFLVLLLTFGTIFCIYHDGNSEEQTVTEYDEDSIQSDKEDSSEGLSEQENNKTEIVESTLLASGLAIIGIAISIWAGLNIIQVLEKDKLLELEKQVTQYKHERYVTNKTLFLRSVQSEPNELNRYIYAKLSAYADEDDDEVTPEMYFELNQIEKMFQLAYKEQLLERRTLRNDYFNEAIEKCEKNKKYIKKRVRNAGVIIDYIEIRILEFNFYKGYTRQTKLDKEVISCYQKVIDGFSNMFPELKEPEKIIRERKFIDNNILLTVYMLNTMGEAYSKIIESYGAPNVVKCCMRENAKMAIKYYEALVSLAKDVDSVEKDERKRLVRETYYRNYGALLERISKNLDQNTKLTFIRNGQIQQLYQKAADIELCGKNEIPRYKAFYTLLSFYIKVIDNYNIKQLLEEKNSGQNYDQKGMQEYSQEMLIYAEIAESRYPTMLYFVKCKAFIMRDLTIWAIKEGKMNVAKGYFEEFQQLVNKLNCLDKGQIEFEEAYPDKMLDELNEDIKTLKKSVEKNDNKQKINDR